MGWRGGRRAGRTREGLYSSENAPHEIIMMFSLPLSQSTGCTTLRVTPEVNRGLQGCTMCHWGLALSKKRTVQVRAIDDGEGYASEGAEVIRESVPSS